SLSFFNLSEVFSIALDNNSCFCAIATVSDESNFNNLSTCLNSLCMSLLFLFTSPSALPSAVVSAPKTTVIPFIVSAINLPPLYKLERQAIGSFLMALALSWYLHFYNLFATLTLDFYVCCHCFK